MKVEIISDKVDGVKIGDNCESCGKKEKRLYHLEDQNFELDIILCPDCVNKFKTSVSNITV